MYQYKFAFYFISEKTVVGLNESYVQQLLRNKDICYSLNTRGVVQMKITSQCFCDVCSKVRHVLCLLQACIPCETIPNL